MPLTTEEEDEVQRMVADLMAITKDGRDQEQVETLAARAVREGRRQTWRDVCDLIRQKSTVDRPNSYFCATLATRLNKPAVPQGRPFKSAGSDTGEQAERAAAELRSLPVLDDEEIEAVRARFRSMPQDERTQIEREARGELGRTCPTLAALPSDDPPRKRALFTLITLAVKGHEARMAAQPKTGPDVPATASERPPEAPGDLEQLKSTRVKDRAVLNPDEEATLRQKARNCVPPLYRKGGEVRCAKMIETNYEGLLRGEKKTEYAVWEVPEAAADSDGPVAAD